MILLLWFLQNILHEWSYCRFLCVHLWWRILHTCSLIQVSHVCLLWGTWYNVRCEWSMRHMHLELRILHTTSLILHFSNLWVRNLPPHHLWVRKKHARPLDEGPLWVSIPHERPLWKMGVISWHYWHWLSRVHHNIFGFGLQRYSSVFPSVPPPLFTLNKGNQTFILWLFFIQAMYDQCPYTYIVQLVGPVRVVQFMNMPQLFCHCKIYRLLFFRHRPPL